MRTSRPLRRLVVLVWLLALLAACRMPGGSPSPAPSNSTTVPRPFTVMSTDPIRVVDPAAITDASSAVLAFNVFQRLMTALPGDPALKPDAARDCLFTAATVYTCTLQEKLAFHNGHPLTSSDVKYSIERAARLAVPGSSAALLSSLSRIETPDPLTVRFLLSRVDTQFGWALASPAGSLVDEELYNSDEVRDPAEPIVGSGPFRVESFTAGQLRLSRYTTYLGRHPARLDALLYRTVADSASVEEAMRTRSVEVVWRGLNAAALTRYAQQVQQNPDEVTADGYAIRTLPGVRVRMLRWSATSPSRDNRGLRQAIAVALQGDRTLESIVPAGITGHIAAFPAGGRAKPKVTWKKRIQLTLAYDPTMPDGRDLATQIRTRLEDTGGLSVRLRPDAANADLVLVDQKAWTPTPLAWLQPYLSAPPAESADTVSALEIRYRASTDQAETLQLLGALQRQAAVDSVVLPVSQSDEYLFIGGGVEVAETSFGPGWQLGLYGMRRG